MTVHYDPKPHGSGSVGAFLPMSSAHATPTEARQRTQGRLSRFQIAQGQREQGLYQTIFKRLLDTALIVVAAPIIVLTVAILAFVVSLDGGNPFYFQDRVGRGGRIFRMWKLRSMVVDADQKLAAHLESDAAAQQEWNSTQKLRDDPRITRFGRVLRKCSLDELPQLYNVLIGDMSLVGPRPMLPEQRVLYPGTAYYRLRPGITGPWQVSVRNESTFAARAQFDQDYVGNLSLSTDLMLLTRTVAVVFHATGC